MVLEISKKQLSLLGDRLVAGPISTDDRELFQRFLNHCDDIQVRTRQATTSLLAPLGLTVTGRTKTTGTILDKLRREHGIKLPYLRDIAGLRVVGAANLPDQDQIAELICDQLDTGGKPDLVDRRATPIAGYRALHVVIKVEGTPVEVQIRTALQALWAELYERQADLWGRQLRYGQGPTPDPSGDVTARQAFIDDLIRLSVDYIAHFERSVSEQILDTKGHQEHRIKTEALLRAAKAKRGEAAVKEQSRLRSHLAFWERSAQELAEIMTGYESSIRELLDDLATRASSIP